MLSFAAAACRSEMGITSPLQPDDNTLLGNPADDGTADPEDAGGKLGEWMNGRTFRVPRALEKRHFTGTPMSSCRTSVRDRASCAKGYRLAPRASFVPQRLGHGDALG